jgi:hypothetical protein
MPGFRLEERAVDGIGRCAAMAMDSGRGRAHSPSRTPTPMGILVVTNTDATTRAPLAGASFRVFDRGDPKNIVPSLTTRSSGTDQTSPLVAPTYCLEETAVPHGYPLAPRYTPAQALPLNRDGTVTVSVPDPPAPTPPDGKARA